MEADRTTGLHHVVWCVEPENLERVRSFWEGVIGVALDELDLPDLGLRVLISWQGGVEIMTPAYASGSMAEAARHFLAERGEGVYSVVYGVRGIEDVVTSFAESGGRLLFRETIPPDAVEARKLSDTDRFSVLQAGFDDYCGMRVCLQEILPEGSSSDRRNSVDPAD
jgi:predicted enzyme related to lactoylglutathione lyase